MLFSAKNLSRLLRFPFAICSLLIFQQAVSSQVRAIVKVAETTTVDRPTVTIGDIATVSGSEEVVDRIRGISLGRSPNVGTVRVIREPQIELAISAAGFTESKVSLHAPDSITILRASQPVPASSVRAAIESSILSKFESSRIEVRIVRLEVPENVQVATGKMDIRVDLSSVRNLFAPFTIPVEIRTDGSLARSFPATAEIEAYGEVVVAMDDLPAGAELTDAKVRLECVRLTRASTSYLFGKNGINGTSLIRNVVAGAEITTDSIVSIAVVKPGDTVKVEAGSGNFRISISAEARNAGRIGDKITVKNPQTGSMLQATVIDKGLVRIAF